jgi:Tol biopolymer transport system component
VDTLGNGLQELWSANGGLTWYPRWSPDGSRIAFTAKLGNGLPVQLWVMNSDGSGPRQLTSYGTAEFFSWSPDGRRIAYVRFNDAFTSEINGTIWLIDVTTGEDKQLTFNPPPS